MVFGKCGAGGPFVGRGRQSCHLPDLAIHRHEAGQTAKSRADLGGHTFRFYLGHNDERGGNGGRHWCFMHFYGTGKGRDYCNSKHGQCCHNAGCGALAARSGAFTPQIYSKWAPLAPCSLLLESRRAFPFLHRDEHCAFQKALLAMLSFSAIVLVARGISALCNFTQSLNNIRGSRANFGIYQQCGIFLVILVRLWKAQAVYNKTGIESKKKNLVFVILVS